MSGDRRDRDLDALLGPEGGELGRLYRKLPRVEPPRRLDRAVLAEAARAVRGTSDRSPRRQRWLLGLGSAAGMVLAAGIAWQAMHEPGAPAAGSAPASQQAAPVGVIPVEPILALPPAPSPPPPSPPAAEAERAAAAPARPAERARAAPARAIEQKAQPRPAPAPPAPAADTLKAPAPAPAPESTAGAAAQRQEAAEAPVVTDAAPRRTGPGLSPAPITSTELRRNMRLPPQRWLDEIRRLDREGQRHWAGENLRLFQRVHPRHEVPADLQPLLDD